MPRDKSIRKVMVIGSGPIVIGQAAEFDYAGAQACKALKEEGLEVVLINSNPATIMTDHAMATNIYIEPLTLPTIRRIIEKEKPDSLLPTLGGQTGLTLAMQLAKEGFLQKQGVRLIGADPITIDKAEDRQLFKDTMQQIGQPCIPSLVVNDVQSALDFAEEIGYPLIVRPAFTLGGAGGGIAKDAAALREIAAGGLRQSPIEQILVEQCISGWKEIEFEVVRDRLGNAIIVCSMENIDPVGVHTGDSIVIAPAVTMADREFQMLRTAALDIVNALGVEGGCNCQFALKPDSFEYAVIEVNPRVSRSSALASKATGYPIAKVAAKIAIGYTLDEIPNAVTGKTFACSEPTVDYVVIKMPKWPFDKFVYGKRLLGTQMKATGEVMAIADSFEQALMKAVRGAEIGQDTLSMARYETLTDEEVEKALHIVDDERIFMVHEALKRGIEIDTIYGITMIDPWFLGKIRNLADMEKEMAAGGLDEDDYLRAKRMGFPDAAIRRISGQELPCAPLRYGYKMVDTCAGEVAAQTPYFYASCDPLNEAAEFIQERQSGKKRAIVFGSGPIRIGQGIEFDYASVHCVWALKKCGYEVAIVNNNPETVSTDFDTADRLYFEPLTAEDVRSILDIEKPDGVVVAFGGQTAIKLTRHLKEWGIPILGTQAEGIDAAEDREKFDAVLEELGLDRPAGHTVMDAQGALEAARALGYPVLLRPSYVLGGQNMLIAFGDEDVREYMDIIMAHGLESPVLVDTYLAGLEIEVDAICDGEDILIPGIMEHIERAGVHSGDSIAIYPPSRLGGEMAERVLEATRSMALKLRTLGLINVQYVVRNGNLYVIEANPRSSRTIPYISKVTGVPMVELATRVMLGEKLCDMPFGTGLYKTPPYVAAKVPVFSFEKLVDVDTLLGPEMKSTGEVLGIGKNFEEALFKGLVAAGYRMTRQGGVLITIRDSDKPEISDVARKFARLGFVLYATKGTAGILREAGLSPQVVNKIHESDGGNNTMTLLESGKIAYMISTSSKGRLPSRDSVKLRRRAVEMGIPCLTSIDTAGAVANILRSRFSQQSTELCDINNMREKRRKLQFVKMQSAGNDYIYFDCRERAIDSPASLSIMLSERHYGIGGDGIVLIEKADDADAFMCIYNMDGSQGTMGGNAVRCVAKYLYDTGAVKSRSMVIKTPSGRHDCYVYLQNGQVDSVRVNMGAARLDPQDIPVLLEGQVIDRSVDFAGEDYQITCVSLGNPHCVFFRDNLDGLDLARIGPIIEHSSLFPERTNVECVQVIDDHTLKVRVWERGNGETLACGTGACAAAVAAVLKGLCPRGEDIEVRVPGGEMVVRYEEDGTILMTGDARVSFRGEVEI